MSCCNRKVIPENDINNVIQQITNSIPIAVAHTVKGEVTQLRTALPSLSLSDGSKVKSIGDDGSLVFDPDNSEPSDIAGYLRDSEDRWIMRPMLQMCDTRMLGVGNDLKTGGLSIIHMCDQPKCEHYLKKVSTTECNMCHLRSNEKTPQPPE
jgi:hypothetical protein